MDTIQQQSTILKAKQVDAYIYIGIDWQFGFKSLCWFVLIGI